MKFTLVSPGKFIMGGYFQSGATPFERPRHSVTISKGFYIGKCEVTQNQWLSVMSSYPGRMGMGLNTEVPKNGNYPIVNVSWNDAKEFVRRLNARENTKSYRLPTEAEWEYCCKAGSPSDYSFGDDPTKLAEYGWADGVHECGKLKPNDWGIFDMHGNAQEWCEDYFNARYYTEQPVIDPKGPASGVFHVIRGNFGTQNLPCRCPARVGEDPRVGYDNLGLRIVKDIATQ